MSRLKYRLFSLLCRIEVTQWRASTPAMCRTYLPPINPEPLPDFAAILKEMSATLLRPDFSAMPSLTPDFSQFEPLKYDFSGYSIDAAKFFDEADALSDHPAASIDHPPLEPLRSSSSSAVDSLSSPDSHESKIANLLTAINDLLVAIKAALRCARALRISWLKKRLISWQRKTKTIRARIQRASRELTAMPSPQYASGATTGSHPDAPVLIDQAVEVITSPTRTSSSSAVKPDALETSPSTAFDASSTPLFGVLPPSCTPPWFSSLNTQ